MGKEVAGIGFLRRKRLDVLESKLKLVPVGFGHAGDSHDIPGLEPLGDDGSVLPDFRRNAPACVAQRQVEE